MLKESENLPIVRHDCAEKALLFAKRGVRRIQGSHLRRNTESSDFVMDIILEGMVVERHISTTDSESHATRKRTKIEDMALYM